MIYYLTRTAKRQDGRRHIQRREEDIRKLIREGEHICNRYHVEIYTGDWKKIATHYELELAGVNEWCIFDDAYLGYFYKVAKHPVATPQHWRYSEERLEGEAYELHLNNEKDGWN